MKIKTRLYVNLFLGTGLAIVFALILAWSSYQIDSELEKSETANKLVRETTDLIMIGEEYLVYRYPRTILQWKAKYNTTMAVLKDMKKSAESDRIKKNLVTLNKSFLKLKENFLETRDQPEKRLSQAFMVLDERLSGQMRILSHNIIWNTLKLSMEATDQTRRIEQKGNMVLFVFLGLFILLTAASLFSTIKKITMSLAGLERDANIINNGNLKHKISTSIDLPHGPRDEIEGLSQSFSNMTGRLVKTIEKLETEVTKRTEAEDKLKKAHDGLEKKVEERTEELAKANNRLIGEIEDRKQTEETLQRKTHDLDERVKELNCLYGISSLIEKPDISLYEIIQGVADLIPPSWRYPEIACSRIIFEDKEYKTGNFKETAWKQSSEIFATNKRMGVLEICYLEEKPEIDEGPFLKEERNLIGAITERLGRIIERMRMTEKQEQLESQLQHAKKMESIGTLAGGIAHNFNNLLMGIQGNASMMLLNIDSGNPRHKNLKTIEKLVENGAKLTAQLIGYAREGKYEVKPISLNQLVKDTSDTFGMTKREITVHQDLSERLYGIEADQGQIEQILLNLYVNAVDAMPGGGDLFLKTMNVIDKDMTGKLYKAKPGNYVLLTVRDTGIGMDKETRERVFEPFFTTKGLASGTGLGMASAYGIIKGHGGYIDVDSGKGKGTTFSIYLPATEKMIEEKKVLSDELVKGKGTVLLVDDEKMFLEVGEELLTHLEYEVLLAENGREALELYKKNQDKIDLVLLDMVMPVMGGGEAFDRMKEINTNVKVLLSSGYSLEGEAKEILKRGCDAFIQKPFKMEQLSQKLREILDKK